MKPTLAILLSLLLFASCTTPEESLEYTVHDYRNVKLYLDTLNAKLQAEYDSTGSYIIQYTDLTNESNKHLVFFGTSHNRDTSHPQWAQLIKAFNSLNPQIAFNEGGQIASDKHFPTIDSAIHASGETGVLKYLSDSTGISMMNGDMDDNEEFSALLAEQPREQVYLYMAIERFLNGYKDGHFPGLSLEEGWKTKFIAYLQRSGFKPTAEEESFDYLKKLYRQYLHADFVLDSIVPVHEYYLINDGELGDVSRATKTVRDKALLDKIDQALDEHDRVFVVFGGSHRVAVEPALRQIMKKKRK